MQRWPSLHHGVRGDWKWHKQLWNLTCWWGARSVCHLCTAQLNGPARHLQDALSLISCYLCMYILYIYIQYIYIYIYIYCNVLFLVLPQPLYINQESMYQEIQYTGANIIRVANRIGFRIAFYDKFRPQSLSSHCCGTFILHILILLQMQLQIIITI